MKPLKEIRIGIIGVGLLGNIHNQAIQTIIEGQYLSKDIEVSVDALCDTRQEHLESYAKTWAIEDIFSDYKKLIALDEINTVYIATPTVCHKDIFLKAAEAGKDIFIQKPLAFSTSDIQEMIDSRDENDIYVQVGHSLRQNPGFWNIRRIIQKKEYKEKMGRLFNIHFRSDQEKPYTGSGFHPSKWRRDKKQALAGTLYEHSIHDFDMMRYWFGDEYQFSDVFAKAKYFFDIDQIEDSVGVLAELKKESGGIGATFALTAVWHNIHRDARHIEVFWENAHLEAKYSLLNFTGTLEIEGEEDIELIPEEMDQKYRDAIGYNDAPSHWLQSYGYETLLFLDSLIKGKPNPLVATLEDSQRSHQIVAACYQSSRENRVVCI